MSTHVISDAERAAFPVARAALVGRASAYGPVDAIVFALGSSQLLRTPEEAAELERLRAERAALNEVLAGGDEERGLMRARLTELQPLEGLRAQECPRGQHRNWHTEADAPDQLPCPWCRIAELEAAVLPAYVYRAEHEGIPMGTYRTRDAARDHITQLLDAEGVQGARSWVPDHGGEDAPEEMTLFGSGEDDEGSTGYVVVPVPIDEAYDPEAEG